MPDEGAAGTSAALEGSWRGGNLVWTPRVCLPEDFRGTVELGIANEEALDAIADVERTTSGRRDSESLPSVEEPYCESFWASP